MKIKVEDIGTYLKSHEIKPSFQRMRIFEYLITHRNHPTVEMIYKSLVKEIPTLSKTTVYNTLNLFVEKKIAIVIVIEENETRYDADMGLHGHFKCEECLSVYDIDVEPEKIEIKGLGSFQVNEHHLYFKGICNNCLNKKSS